MDPSEDRIKKILYDLIQKYEADARKYVMLAGAYKQLGDTDKALSILYNGLKNDKSNASAKMMVADILYDRWLIDESKKQLEEIINISPDNEKALDMLYDIYTSEESLDRALEILYLKLVFGKDSNDKEGILKQIEDIRSNRYPGPRISDLSKNIRQKLTGQSANTDETSEKSEEISESMADHYISQGHYNKAVEILEELVKKHPNDIHLRTRLTLCQASIMFDKNFMDSKKISQ